MQCLNILLLTICCIYCHVKATPCTKPSKLISVKVVKNPDAEEEALQVTDFSSLTEYETIIVENTSIPHLCEKFVNDLPNLKVLDLSECNIESIEKNAFYKVPNLKILNLSKNKLKEVKSGIFNDLSIENLYLVENLIHTIEADAIANMPNLELIDFSKNQIETINTEWFENCPNLYSIWFNSNVIKKVPSLAFKKLAARNMNLHLSNNKIEELETQAFATFLNVGNIYLNKNHLTNISMDSFGTMIHGSKLVIADNKLSCFSHKVADKLKIFDKVCAHNSFDAKCQKHLLNFSHIIHQSCT